MKNEIRNRIPIHVDLAPNRDEVHSGICLKSTDNIFIFVRFNEETYEFDGFAIIRGYEVEKYREWDDEELGEIKNNNFTDFLGKLRLEKMDDLFQCLSELKTQKLISVFNGTDDDTFFVGHIENLTENYVELKLMNEAAEWSDNEKINIDEITYISFDTSYEKELLKKNALQQKYKKNRASKC